MLTGPPKFGGANQRETPMRALLAALCLLTLFATAAAAQGVGDNVYVGTKFIGKIHAIAPGGYIVKVKRWYQIFAKKKVFYAASAVIVP